MTPHNSPKKMGRPRRELGETSTRDRILQVSIDLFTKHGFANTTFRDIAEELGLTESAIYRHFTNKDSVLETILVEFQERIYQPLSIPSENTDPEAIIGSILTGLPRLLLTNPQLLQISKLLLGELQHNEKIRSFVKEALVIKANLYVEELIQRNHSVSSLTWIPDKSFSILINSLRFGWVYSTFVLQNPSLDDLPTLERELRDISSFIDQAISNQRIK